MGESDIATLALVGGWLEGMRVVSNVLAANYKEETSSILYQPSLIEYFTARFAQMNPQTKEVAVVGLIGQKLAAIKQLCDVGKGNPVPQNRIAQLQSITTELVKAIEGSKA